MAGLFALASVSAAHADSLADHTTSLPTGPDITQVDVETAQKAWGDAVVTIGKTDSDEAAALAEKIARSAYAFELGPIQFKPTLADEQPFRPDVEGTVSYFVGGNDKYPEDKGFALTPWPNVRFDNHTVKMHGNIAIAMGHYYFTNASGSISYGYSPQTASYASGSCRVRRARSAPTSLIFRISRAFQLSQSRLHRRKGVISKEIHAHLDTFISTTKPL